MKNIKWILACAFIFAMSYYISENWYQLLLIQGDSMSPTYKSMQIVVLDKYSREYDYDDVIAFWCDSLETVMIKRIVARPGDTVVIQKGTLYVNGEVSEVFPKRGQFEYAGELAKTCHLGDEEYIVIGDNLKESKDSRYVKVGKISGEYIFGKLIK